MTDKIVPKFNDDAMKVLCKRYLRPVLSGAPCALCGKLHETPEEMFERCSFGTAEYYNLLASLDFLPGSPTLFNAGTGQGTFSSCFKFDVQDSMDSIMDVARKAAFAQKWGGGVGYCLSELRPFGAPIRTTHGRACGPVAVLELYHSVAKMITQGGKREGAQMGILHCSHPDLMKFVHSKDLPDACQCSRCTLQKECGSSRMKVFDTFNISVAVTDEFMKAATRGQTHEGDCLREIVESAWGRGDPGLYFIDAAERANPTPWLGELTGTNPCGEVPLLDNEPCNIGSINLAHMVGKDGFDWDRLESTVRLAVRYLDDALDRNEFPDPAMTEAAHRTRKLGLGVMGWADALTLMRVHYDSEEAVKLAEDLMKFIQVTAHDESRGLGDEKGCCPAFVGSRVTGPLIRNAALTCIAPTGTISVLAGCNSGIEPYFTLKGRREMGDGTPLVERVRVDAGDFVPHTAHQIGWEWHLKHQAAFQTYTDLAVSKTVNLPEDATRETVWNVFVMAWRLGCKGVTVYRDKSRGRQVLTEKGAESYPTDARYGSGRRKLRKDGVSLRHKFDVGDMEGYLHIGVFEDGLPAELFITGTKQGSTISGLLDCLAIVTSLALQYGVPLDVMASKLAGTRFEPAGLTSNSQIPTTTSLADYIFRYMMMRCLNSQGALAEYTGMLCPDCGAVAMFEEGCLKCSSNCGWSRC